MATYNGTAAGETLSGTEGDDTIEGLGGNDLLYGLDGNDILRGGDGIDNISGGDGDDRLEGGDGIDYLYDDFGNDVVDGGEGDDHISNTGGAGDDLLIGGSGADLLSGGTGGDLFRFFDGDSGTGTQADRITDFVNWVDKIDLRDVDADTGIVGNQAFSWIGTTAFSGTAGELRYFFDGTDTWLQADYTGDGVSDFEIAFTGSLSLFATDFYL